MIYLALASFPKKELLIYIPILQALFNITITFEENALYVLFGAILLRRNPLKQIRYVLYCLYGHQFALLVYSYIQVGDTTTFPMRCMVIIRCNRQFHK